MSEIKFLVVDRVKFAEEIRQCVCRNCMNQHQCDHELQGTCPVEQEFDKLAEQRAFDSMAKQSA